MVVRRVLVPMLLTAAAVAGFSTALYSQRPVDEKRYGGVPLSDWERRLGDLDPKSPGAESVVDALIEIVNDAQLPATTRRRFAVTLGRIGAPAARAIPALVDKIERRHELGDDSYVWAARALGLYGVHARPAVPALIELLFDESIPRGYRQLSLETLAQVGTAHPAVMPAMLRLLQYQPSASSELSAADASVLREYAAETLAIIGQEAYFAAPLLVRVVRDTSETESVRRKAIVALGAIGGAAHVAIPALIETMEFESPTLRGAAAEALPKLGPAVVPVLREYLQHQRVELRQLAAEGLGQMGQGAASAVGQLLRCLDSDEQDSPRIACCEALHAIGVEPSRYAEPLIALLASEDRQVRMRAMRLLVTIGGQLGPYLESLRRMQNDPRPHARAIARKALQKIEG